MALVEHEVDPLPEQVEINLRKALGLDVDVPLISMWPNFGDGRKLRVFMTGPKLTDLNEAGRAQLPEALQDLLKEI